jgi:arsenite methyltransferase
MDESREKEIKEAVKTYYAQRARAMASCCGPEASCDATAETAACCSTEASPAVAQEACCVSEEASCVSPQAAECSLGCGDPLVFSEIGEGDVVLDIGSGAGMEVIAAAQRVGASGKVIGLDMTPEMIATATRNAERAGVAGIAEFRLGEMEDMPIDEESVDSIISNCVVNLSPDKATAFREAYRVLKPGGSMFISDLVSENLPEAIRDDLTAWAGCVAGTVEQSEYLNLMRDAGFESVAVVDKADVTCALLGGGCCGGPADPSGAGKIHSIKVRAIRPSR